MKNLFFIIKEIISNNLKRILYQLTSYPFKTDSDELHLKYSMDWLKNAYKNGDGGVASHYDLLRGKWLNPFPETTGYIIPTFFDYFHKTGDKYYFDTAIKMTDWLIKVQIDNGACMQGSYDKTKGKNNPIIFNTGQNIFGFLRSFKETKNEKYLQAAIKAGDFLVDCVDENGIWNKYLHNNIPHTYNSRTSWALLQLFEVTKKKEYKKIAISNLNWVLDQQQKNGWFKNANFKPGELPNTHGIAYTLRGLLESYLLIGNEKHFNAVIKTSEKLMKLLEVRGNLFTFWDKKWKNHGKFLKNMQGRYVCLTGNIQLAIIFMKIFKVNKDLRFVNAAFKLIDFVKSTQNLTSNNPGIRGGIKGTFPVNGNYSFLKFPNWATKFFADSIIIKSNITEDIKFILK